VCFTGRSTYCGKEKSIGSDFVYNVNADTIPANMMKKENFSSLFMTLIRRFTTELFVGRTTAIQNDAQKILKKT